MFTIFVRGDQIKVNCFKKEFRWVISKKEN